MDAAEEVVRIYQNISGFPAKLLFLTLALNHLGICYREAGRGVEIDAKWKAAVDSQEHPEEKAFLLLRRAEGRGQVDISAVDELIQAKSYLIDIDNREQTADFHRVCQSLRDANPVDFGCSMAEQVRGGSATMAHD